MLGLLSSEASASAFPGVALPLLLSQLPLVGLPSTAMPGQDCPLLVPSLQQVSVGVGLPPPDNSKRNSPTTDETEPSTVTIYACSTHAKACLI